jgi:hypothetical protein
MGYRDMVTCCSEGKHNLGIGVKNVRLYRAEIV